MTADPTKQEPSTQEIKLRKLLEELFMFDQADLDFGIYRIMNAKREEITRFLEGELLPQAREVLGVVESGERAQVKAELDKAIENARALGVDPDAVPRVKELRDKYGSETDHAALEAEVFSHLYSFLRRYYSEGDFISQRRYKAGVYAVPYEGEEVKLHWANHDQYYIKTGENFRDYAFRLPDRRLVHFKLTDADTERNNNKATAGQERRFTLVEDQPLVEENGELVIRFAYQPDEKKRKQAHLNDEAVKRIRASVPADWRAVVEETAPTEKDAKRLLLEKHLNDYTARNSFDYFIHKDLGGFLRRELDFYVKNEVVHLDDIEHESAPRVEQYLGKVRAIRRVALQIIEFLSQLEDFQKRLWLKKKFVVGTNYCITLDRVPEELYPEIVKNGAQREEWVRLFAIDEVEKDLTQPGYSVPLSVDFLKANSSLVLDTAFFTERFRDRLLASIDDLDAQTDGVLLHSENFQALQLVAERYRSTVDCIYIDPPYNASSSEIAYKNTYKHASWLSLMENRLSASKAVVSDSSVIVVAIDEVEQERLGLLLENIFPSMMKTCVTVIHNATGQQGANFSATHEYAYFLYPPNGSRIGLEDRADNPDVRPLRNVSKGSHLRTDAANCFYPIFIAGGEVVGFGDVCPDEFHPAGMNVTRPDGTIEVYPIDQNGVERKWVFARQSVDSILPELSAKPLPDGSWDIIRTKTRFNFKTVWQDRKYSANSWGSRVLNMMLPENSFTFPKSVFTVRDSVDAALNNANHGVVLDFFGGSGTTAHAVINLNREDSGARRYVVVEMGEYFDTVLKPRVQKAVYSPEWRDGKPITREGSSHMFKYIRLESYEDTLNNLELKRTPEQQDLLDTKSAFRNDYMLRYILEVETRDSASLLNLELFEDPFNYELKIGTGSTGETRPVKVDLVETFNYLLGLRVKRIDRIPGIRIVQGTSLAGERVLVIWRNTREVSSEDIDAFFRKHEFNPGDAEFDIIYVNGDNNLENLRRSDETWKVRLIEEEFLSRMFDLHDV